MKPTTETYSELQQAYDFFNAALFDGVLPDCLITLQREKHTCGYFSAGRFASIDGKLTDEIAINPSYFAVTTIVEVLQTLVHEMVHLWQYHFGTPGRGRYHNKEWADKMESIGLMPSSTGQPGGNKTGDCMGDYAINGGPFLRACADLVTNEFRLSWYDRYPDSTVAHAGQNSYSLQLNDMPESATEIVANKPNSLVQVRNEQSQNESETPQVNSKATRMKYTCGCGINLWAKPDITVECCECRTIFQYAA